MKLKQFILKYINETIAIIIILGLVIGTTIYYNYDTSKDNNPESCQELIDSCIIKDQLLEAYRDKDVMVTKFLKNNKKLIDKQEIMIIDLETLIKDQEMMLELREKQIKTLGGEI